MELIAWITQAASSIEWSKIKWGDLATWASAIASTAAVIVALRLARTADHPRAKGNLSVVVFPPHVEEGFLMFDVRNLGTHKLVISSAFLECRPLFRRFLKWPSGVAYDWRAPYNSPLPCSLDRGESFRYSTHEKDDHFGALIAGKLLPPHIVIRMMRAGVGTPWGSIYVPMTKQARQAIIASARRQESKGRD